MTQEPLVSVIIPAYNAEKYIEMAVKSVLKQSYPNIEIIVINDGSTDNTMDVLSHLDGCVVVSTENKGVSNARNVGIDISKGEYISFLDADDELEKYAIESLMNACLKYDADICGGLYSENINDGSNVEEFFDQDTLLRYCIEDRFYTSPVWSKIYKKKFIGNARFMGGYRLHEDHFFNFELALKMPKCVNLNKLVYRKRAVSTSASCSTKASDSYLDINRLAKIKYEKIIQEYPEYKDYAKNILIKANLASLIKIMNMKGIYKKYEDVCINDICRDAKFYIPVWSFENKLFFIITHHLYRPFKLYMFFRRAVSDFVRFFKIEE